MIWTLFLDDLRTLSQAGVTKSPGEIILIARSFDEAVSYVEAHGVPNKIHFDHDLGDDEYSPGNGEKTGYGFAKWFCDYIQDKNIELPKDFCYNVHSANPVGVKRITNYMDSFINYVRNEN